MVERSRLFDIFTQVVLLLGFLAALGPIALVVIAASQNLQEVNTVPMPLHPGSDLWHNLTLAWSRARLSTGLVNGIAFATAVAAGKVVLSAISAFSIVFFNYRGRIAIFWIIFVTLMLPLEVRIVPTYAVASNVLGPYQAILDLTGITALINWITGIRISMEWGMLNSLSGLTLPLVATVTGTFLYRQFFMTIPNELVEASRMDGSGPLRFFIEVLLPLSKSNMAALFTIMFIWAWNQYLWPLLVTTDPDHAVAVTNLKYLIPDGEGGPPEWNVAMAGTLIVLLPPLVVVIVMQRWFVRGLVATEK
ncbi:MAG: ABC transporter permease subunit [Rhizobiales bacterium]|nr:ABC transporter permease subunit [Hyphomicrobiales bacterium]OJY04880.1 MAG: ABC transporter permease [Rhizobiales bacterium 63-22]